MITAGICNQLTAVLRLGCQLELDNGPVNTLPHILAIRNRQELADDNGSTIIVNDIIYGDAGACEQLVYQQRIERPKLRTRHEASSFTTDWETSNP